MWGHAVELWVNLKDRSESDLLSLRKFSTFYKDRPLSRVTGPDIERALSFCRTAGTYTRYRTTILAILNAAKERGWINELPKVPARVGKKVARAWITKAEWAKLHAELPAHMAPMAQFAIETGLRQANVLGLTWARVDLARKLVWVEAEDTKGDAAIAIPLSTGALDVLKAVQGIHDVFVFTFRGKPIKEVKTAFQAACARADVGSHVGGSYQGFTWHGFRHTWATWHVQNGTPLDVLQKLGGWSDLRMVMNYAHHSAGHLQQFADNATKE
jgi:integrase